MMMDLKLMDKLAEQLKKDARKIDVHVSDELDRRISASLRSVEIASQPEAADRPASGPRPAIFWWASSVTGVLAALALIVIININVEPPQSQPSESIVELSPVPDVVSPLIDWQTESAMLTSPLQQELIDLQSDIRKAEAKVKQDIGL